MVFFFGKNVCTSKGCGEGNFFPKVVFFFGKNVCTSKGYGGERETLKSGVFFLAKMCVSSEHRLAQWSAASERLPANGYNSRGKTDNLALT